MSKTLEVFSVWFGITITELKKCVRLGKSKFPFSDRNWKILVWLKHIFSQICKFLRECLFTKPASKGTNIRGMKKKLWGMLCL